MKEKIAFCGLDCSKCEAFIATKNDDDSERTKVAEKWCKLYRKGIKPEDINCDGCCQSGGRLFSHCKVCKIRKCGLDKKVENCGYCKEYPCKELKIFLDRHGPGLKKNLDMAKKK